MYTVYLYRAFMFVAVLEHKFGFTRTTSFAKFAAGVWTSCDTSLYNKLTQLCVFSWRFIARQRLRSTNLATLSVLSDGAEVRNAAAGQPWHHAKIEYAAI